MKIGIINSKTFKMVDQNFTVIFIYSIYEAGVK